KTVYWMKAMHEMEHQQKFSYRVSGVLQYGERQNPRQTLVLLHGFTGCAANWSDLLPSLATPGRRLIALDLLGHGLADAPADPARYSIACYQSDILATLCTLGI